MPLTPEDVSNKRFTPVRLREGYDMGEVDQFLDEVEAELARLTRENDDLRSKLATAQTAGPGSSAASTPTFEAPPQTPPVPEPVAPQPVAETAAPAAQSVPQSVTQPVATTPHLGATNRTGSIETIRVETVAEASNAAARLLEIATRNADEVVEEAKNEADKIVGEARTKAERLESESKGKADRLESEARSRAQMLDSETAERRQQVLGELERERDKLGTEVDTLRSFEREYRSRLKSYFTQQLESLGGPNEQPAMPDESATPPPKRLRSILGEDEA